VIKRPQRGASGHVRFGRLPDVRFLSPTFRKESPVWVKSTPFERGLVVSAPPPKAADIVAAQPFMGSRPRSSGEMFEQRGGCFRAVSSPNEDVGASGGSAFLEAGIVLTV
jgi:hypothetical protein